MVPREHLRWKVQHGGHDVRGLRPFLALLATLSMVLIGAATVSASPLSAKTAVGSKPYTCTGHHGGIVPSGTYSSLLITGVCYAPAGTVIVKGNLTVAPGALLDAAATLGDPVASPILPATVVVGGNVSVGRGAVLVLGCSPLGGCEGVTYDRIGGNLTAIKAQAVLMQAVSIGGNVTVLGGGGGVIGGPPKSGGCFAPTSPIPAPWSEDPALSQGPNGSPQYTDFEDSTIGGNLSVIGMRTCYLASFRDRVGGSVTFAANATSDPDGMELGSNLVGGNLACFANVPAVQFGDASAAPNMVHGAALGECGFNVVLGNPPVEHGIREHISVRTSSLGTYSGRHIQTASVASMDLGTTASGDELIVALNNVVLRGSGLQGRITVVPGSPLGSTGEAVAITVHPDGSQSFEAFDKCMCHFDGQSGMVSIEAYGTTSADGSSSGIFLVTSNGAGGGGLARLAGYGTFSNSGEPAGTLGLTEHLRIT
jgi:hypothetical protein